MPKLVKNILFFAVSTIFIVLAGLMLWQYFSVLALAGILTLLFLPLQKFLVRELKHEGLSALITVVVIMIIVVVPIYYLSQAVVVESINFYGHYSAGGLAINEKLLTTNLPASWQKIAVGLAEVASERIGSWSRTFGLDVAGILSNITQFFFFFFLLFFSIFYLLKDYGKLKDYFDGLFHFSAAQEDLLIGKVAAAVNGVAKGNLLIALLQGVAAVIGFILAGLPQPLFWGIATIVSAFIPMVGTGIVIVPAIFYLLFFKSLTAAIILIVWYVVVHLSIDNIIRPKFISARTQMHPLLALFGVVGGLKVFGVLGFLFGPIVIAILIVLVDFYRASY